MEHGASAETDVTALFVTNKPFHIDYVDTPAAIKPVDHFGTGI
jgi:hypothetical protein